MKKYIIVFCMCILSVMGFTAQAAEISVHDCENVENFQLRYLTEESRVQGNFAASSLYSQNPKIAFVCDVDVSSIPMEKAYLSYYYRLSSVNAVLSSQITLQFEQGTLTIKNPDIQKSGSWQHALIPLASGTSSNGFQYGKLKGVEIEYRYDIARGAQGEFLLDDVCITDKNMIIAAEEVQSEGNIFPQVVADPVKYTITVTKTDYMTPIVIGFVVAIVVLLAITVGILLKSKKIKKGEKL